MKKISLSLMAIAALAMTSCSNDEAVKAPAANGAVTFHVVVPQSISSRAISDGTTVEDLYWAVFDENGDFVEEFSQTGAFAGNNMAADVNIHLVNGKKYTLAFWAQHPDAPYTFSNGTVTVDYSAGKKAANDEVRDAFYGTFGPFTWTSDFDPGQDIVLSRPFAQVNVGTNDWDVASAHNAVPTQTGMAFTATVYQTLKLYDGTVANPVEVDFDLAALPDNDGDATTVDEITVEGTNYKWIGMNYILVPNTKENISTVTFKHDYNNGSIAINTVPVQRNFRTNIIGSILTGKHQWRIVIDNNYKNPDNKVNY